MKKKRNWFLQQLWLELLLVFSLSQYQKIASDSVTLSSLCDDLCTLGFAGWWFWRTWWDIKDIWEIGTALSFGGGSELVAVSLFLWAYARAVGLFLVCMPADRSHGFLCWIWYVFLFSPMIGGLTWCTTVQVLLLQTRLEEELELRSVLESALSNVSGPLTSFPHHLPIAVRSRISWNFCKLFQ